MKAILIDKDTNALSWSDVPNPVVGPEDALVEIHAAALNRADLMQRAGDYPPPPGCPEWMGLEIAGVIVELGEEAKKKSSWKIGDKVNYALEGSIFVGGSVVQWLRDGLGIIRSSSEVEALASSVPDTGGVYFVPALTGLAAPYWDQYARGAISGISRGTTAAHIARAALEGIAYQTLDIVGAMQRDSGITLRELKVDGGAAANNYLLQTQADISNAPVERPSSVETTALGAAYLAGLAVGFWSGPEELAKKHAIDKMFVPDISEEERRKRLRGWHKAVRCAYNWARDDDEDE